MSKTDEAALSDKIIGLIEQARTGIAKAANTAMVVTYFHIGKLIVEELQEGEDRAAYGKQLLKQTSERLTKHIGKGFSVQNLERMRNFFLTYSAASKELRNTTVFQKSSNT